MLDAVLPLQSSEDTIFLVFLRHILRIYLNHGTGIGEASAPGRI